MKPASYFPVHPAALRMRAGLARFGTDFGNSERDRHFFQIDDHLGPTLQAKHAPALRGSRAPLVARHRLCESEAHPAILEWMRRTLAREHPERFADGLPDSASGGPECGAPTSDFDALLRCVQEDAAVVQRLPHPDGGDVATMLHVCFPSDWRPERLLGASFRTIHAPVPGFADDEAFARGMLDAMVERGPYVRFVWILSGDDVLDHHPDEGGRVSWQQAVRGWLRVERQVTVGFPEWNAALFLIRTYLYSFEEIGSQRRAVIARAIDSMPEEVARYKGIAGHEARIHRLLARAGSA